MRSEQRKYKKKEGEGEGEGDRERTKEDLSKRAWTMGFMGRRPVYEINSRDPMMRMLRMRSHEGPVVLPISATSRTRREAW